jgi:signal transduction histidine kinase
MAGNPQEIKTGTFRRAGAFLRPYLYAFLCVLAVTVLGAAADPYLDLGNVALLYLLPVLVSAALWSSASSFFASVLGVLAFDYLFVPPAFSLRPAHSRDFFVLAIFLTVAAVTGTMATRLRNEVKQTKKTEEQLRQTGEQLRALSARLVSIREDERTRLARDIHDELGQTLTGLKMDLARLSRRPPADAEHLADEIRPMGKVVDDIIQAVRRISTQLRPAVLDLGLVPAIEWQLDDFQRRTGIHSALASKIDDTSLGPDRSTALFRIVQEALTNVARHAEASRVDVDIRQDNGYITLCVTDNGKGITADQVSDGNSLGLLGIRERAFLLGGRVEIVGGPEKGTTVTVRIPKE